MQGGSVVKALAESSKPYRIRGIGRDVTKPAAQALSKQGVEMVAADIADRAAIDKAFAGADIVFAVTDFWAHLDKAKEVADGKRLVDAAKAAGVHQFIFSGLPSHTKISNGKYSHVGPSSQPAHRSPSPDHFDGKADIVDYALSVFGKDHFSAVAAHRQR